MTEALGTKVNSKENGLIANKWFMPGADDEALAGSDDERMMMMMMVKGNGSHQLQTDTDVGEC